MSEPSLRHAYDVWLDGCEIVIFLDVPYSLIFKLLTYVFNYLRVPVRHIDGHGGEVPFADCNHPVGDCERAEY